jgi:dipeptidyl aminopeptidase/acylaminoacyl peptidase
VPSGQAREMAAELEHRGKTHECCIYPDEGHQFAGPDAIIDSVRRIERFLESNLTRRQGTEVQNRSAQQRFGF